MLKILRQMTLGLLTVVVPSFLGAQTGAPAVDLKIGDMAPDFTLPSSTMNGVSAAPIKLSSLRGKTVVLAFFPKARTSGCTIEMEHFRDEYATIFGGGKSAILLAVSSDSAAVTASWAAESKFPFTFAADVNMDAGKLYGTVPARGTAQRRDSFVIGPDGRISAIMRNVLPSDPTSYTSLTAAIAVANKGAKQ